MRRSTDSFHGRSFPPTRTILTIQMSARTNMASRTVFSDQMRAALDMRATTHVCPADVEATLAKLPYFRARGGAGGRGGGTRFPVLGGGGGAPAGGAGTGWRHGGGGGGAPRSSVSEDGFQQVWHGRRGGDAWKRRETGAGAGRLPELVVPPTAAATASVATAPVVLPAAPSGAKQFSAASVRAGVDMEDRLLARVKGKINKFGYGTYDATKAFMQQILDSDEPEFLDEFMKFVFQKAATEASFCPLYARLLHELADEFPHLRTVMTRLFRDYTAIFTELETAPDVGTADYAAFLEAQERKKFRRGYSQFVGELVKCGEAECEAFANVLRQIVSVLETNKDKADSKAMCEEYIDCLANMCTSASGLMTGADWAETLKGRLAALVQIPRSEVPGLTNKGRFALMDLVDYANRGWKAK